MEQNRESTAENAQDEIYIGELLHYLRQKWVLIAAVFLAGILLAGFGTHFLLHPKYTAVSKLYVVSASGKNIVNLDDLRLGTTLSEDYKELLKTRPICNEIIDELGLDYTVGQLRKMISIETVEDTRILVISVVSQEAEEARDIANTMAEKAVTYLPKLMEITAPNIAEEAVTPKIPTSPGAARNAVFGGLLALVLVCVLLTVQFVLDDTVKTAEDVEKLTGVMPLTVILEMEPSKEEKREVHWRKQNEKNMD